MSVAQPAPSWMDVCGFEALVAGAGVCALVGDQQVALVRAGERLYAVDNFDPFAKAFVISRGIVGDHGGVPTIASPIYKHVFALDSGQSLDDPSVRLRVWAVRVRSGRVEVLDE
jgi:nitrite reductase (NADH) small subunit